MNKFQPDIVHLHNLHNNYINLPILFKFLSIREIQTVITLHDCWFYTGKCTHYTVDSCDKWRRECGKCPRLKKDNPSFLVDRTKTMLADKVKFVSQLSKVSVVGVSAWISREARQSIVFRDTPITTIYNWVDLDVFRYTPLKEMPGCPGAKFIILGVASDWSDDKGLRLFNKLACVLDDAQIVLVGNVDKRLKLNEKVAHISEVRDASYMAQLYSTADVFLNLSKEESFGLVTAEALACGTPVITNKSTANPELVDGSCGYILNDTTIENIKNTIDMVKSQPKSFYSAQCRSLAEEKFCQSKSLKKHHDLYKSLVSRQ